MKTIKNLADAIRSLLSALKIKSSLYDQCLVQLTGCSSAALGATKNPAVKGQYGWSQAYQDVLDLRLTYEILLKQNEDLRNALQPFAEAERKWMKDSFRTEIRMDWLTKAREAYDNL